MNNNDQIREHLNDVISEEISVREKKEKRRSAEIIAVFAKHNFYANGLTPAELRSTLEDLGPTYVKIGQIMSSRPDILPERYCKELETLRANVKELDPALAREVIEQETGKKIEEIYSEFRDKPLGSASIGQVHYGVLTDGRKIVTKVRRPQIAETMRRDFVLLKKLAKMVNVVKSDDEHSSVDLLSVIEEFEKVTEEELDFRVEAQNTRFFRENCINDPEKVSCPEVIDELTTEKIFTMTYVDGCSISKKERLQEEGCDLLQIGHDIIENYLHQILDVGTFHADPHQGNIMVADGKPYWIDFGMLGRISDADVNIIQSLILSILGKDLEELMKGVTSLGATSPKTNPTKLTEDLEALLEKYSSVTGLADIDTSVLFDDITDICGNNDIKIPGRFTMLIRSLATIEGVIEQLCPELNLFELLSSKMKERAKKQFDLKQEALNLGRDAAAAAKKAAKIPGLASDALNNLVKGRTKVNMELTGYEELAEKAGGAIKNLILTLFACVLFFGSCVLCLSDIEPKTPQGIPILAVAGFVVSIALAIVIIRKLKKK